MGEKTDREAYGSAPGVVDGGTSPSRRLGRYLLPAAVLVGGVVLGVVLLRSGPRASRTPPMHAAKLVQTEAILLGDRVTTVQAMGTVLPARQITLSARVSGEVVALSPEFVPGGFFRAGQEMMRIDASDYELLVRQRRSALAQAESALRLEAGQQAVARREYELLGKTLTAEERDLVLRQPQLQAARAAVNAARAALEDARLDLQRTRLLAPFPAVLAEKRVDLGAQVNGTTPLGTLVGTDEFWVEALVPVDQLRWLDIPRSPGDSGAVARVYNESGWGEEVFRRGTVIRLRPGLEEQGRMARVLISIQDPLSTQTPHASWPRLILAMYVRVELEGVTLRDVASVSRSALHDGDCVYLMDAHEQLEIRPVTVVFRTPETVLVRGVHSGERLVITDLSAPVQGMPLRLAGAGARMTGGAGREAGS